MTSRAVITVVNSVGPTSMPLNEFVLHRAATVSGEQQVVIAWGPLIDGALATYSEKLSRHGITVIECQGQPGKFRRELERVAFDFHGQIPAVFHIHHPRAGAVFHAVRGQIARKLRTIFTVHNVYPRYRFPTRILARYNAHKADKVTFVSGAGLDAFPSSRASRDRIAIPNGVDTEAIRAAERAAAARPERQKSTSGLHLVTASRIVDVKNHKFLIQLMPQLPNDVTLTIVGDGPLREPLNRMVREAGMNDRVRFMGFLPTRADVYRALTAGDLFVSSSLYEGLPIAVLEGMALGLPMLLSDIEPHLEIAARSRGVQTLALVPEAWREAILNYLAEPRNTLASLGKQNEAAVEAHFSLSRMHRAYSELYAELAR